MQCINIKHINLGQNIRGTACSMISFVEVGKSEQLNKKKLKKKMIHSLCIIDQTKLYRAQNPSI